MEANSSEAKNPQVLPPPLTPRPTKRLLFDKRYASMSGRIRLKKLLQAVEELNLAVISREFFRFCILPIAKSLVNAASQSIDTAIESVGRAMQSPDQFSPHELRANLSDQFARWKLNLMNLGKNNHPNDRENPTKSAEGDPTKRCSSLVSVG